MFCVLGLPGSGKGVQSVLFNERFNVYHVAPGVLLRKKAENNPELDAKLQRGEFIDDNFVGKIILDEIIAAKSPVFIIDGYPRNFQQAKTLENILKESPIPCEIKKIFILNCPEQVVIDRLLNRKICVTCPRSFAHNETECNQCNNRLIKRNDDNLESIKVRINTTKTELVPIVQLFHDKVVYINGDQPIESVYKDMLNQILSVTSLE